MDGNFLREHNIQIHSFPNKYKPATKQRYYNHKKSFRNARHKNETTFSSCLWELGTESTEIPKLTWSVLEIVSGYSDISKRSLMHYEKLYIAIPHNQQGLSNENPELMIIPSSE